MIVRIVRYRETIHALRQDYGQETNCPVCGAFLARRYNPSLTITQSGQNYREWYCQNHPGVAIRDNENADERVLDLCNALERSMDREEADERLERRFAKIQAVVGVLFVVAMWVALFLAGRGLL